MRIIVAGAWDTRTRHEIILPAVRSNDELTDRLSFRAKGEREKYQSLERTQTATCEFAAKHAYLYVS